MDTYHVLCGRPVVTHTLISILHVLVSKLIQSIVSQENVANLPDRGVKKCGHA